MLLLGAAIAIPLVLSGEIAEGTREGLALCARLIVPAVFPFLLLSDLLIAFCDFTRLPLLPSLFRRAFGVGEQGIAPFLIGLLCGFPLGVKCAADLCRAGALDREEGERLIGFCNNTGPAFLIAGVGIGLYGRAAVGAILWLSVILSSILAGLIFCGKHKENRNSNYILKQKYSFVTSVKSAGEKTLGICSFVTLFSIVGHLLGALPERCAALVPYLLPFLEVGSATARLATAGLPSGASLFLTGFAVGFSGLSVHLQALYFLSGSGLRTRFYLPMKFLQGLLCGALNLLLSLLL